MTCVNADATEAVRLSSAGGIGRITLNRPSSVNALNQGMVSAIASQLQEWASDDGVEVIMIDGDGERGLCAGGDIRMFRESSLRGGDEARAFLRTEYRLNAQIKRFQKPVIALMHGIVLGGGVGISAHARIRIVTDNTRLGMPEVSIGFVPDVGGSWLLAHAAGEAGTHLALTGETVGAADAIFCGLADHFVPIVSLARLRSSVSAAELFAAIEDCTSSPGQSPLERQRLWIDECYRGSSSIAMIDNLRSSGISEAASAADRIETRSPIAVAVTLELLRRSGRMASLERALELEYRAATFALQGHDLVEGVRAQVVDRDRMPRWNPASLADVTLGDVAQHFLPPVSGDLSLL